MLNTAHDVFGAVLRHFDFAPSAEPSSLTFTLIAIHLER